MILTDTIDIGEQVACDFCNDDYTHKEDAGGVLIGSYAVCPKCALEVSSKVDGHCPLGMSFRQWVLALRGGDNTIRIYNDE